MILGTSEAKVQQAIERGYIEGFIQNWNGRKNARGFDFSLSCTSLDGEHDGGGSQLPQSGGDRDYHQIFLQMCLTELMPFDRRRANEKVLVIAGPTGVGKPH